MAFAGSIRGAIAFGLAISIQTGSVKNDEVLVSTTLILVFFTTIIFGAMIPSMIKYYKKVDSEMMIFTKRESDDKIINRENGISMKDMEEIASHGTFEYTFSHPNNRFK
jgi:NhaP-type Na+/H+ or K+/H+ antiporter